jgi:hypothetical protein
MSPGSRTRAICIALCRSPSAVHTVSVAKHLLALHALLTSTSKMQEEQPQPVPVPTQVLISPVAFSGEACHVFRYRAVLQSVSGLASDL